MGWASGSAIYRKIIVAAKLSIPDEAIRVEFHKSVIDAFEDGDWDTQNECLGQDPAFDKALAELHADWDDGD